MLVQRWPILSAAQGYQDALEARDGVNKLMTSEQIAEASVSGAFDVVIEAVADEHDLLRLDAESAGGMIQGRCSKSAIS